jgi:hypothetical protein
MWHSKQEIPYDTGSGQDDQNQHRIMQCNSSKKKVMDKNTGLNSLQIPMNETFVFSLTQIKIVAKPTNYVPSEDKF